MTYSHTYEMEDTHTCDLLTHMCRGDIRMVDCSRRFMSLLEKFWWLRYLQSVGELLFNTLRSAPACLVCCNASICKNHVRRDLHLSDSLKKRAHEIPF